LINTFKQLLGEKRTEIMNLKNRYGNGYECLVNTEKNVTVMQQQLTDLQPILVSKGKETEEQLIIVSKETEAADKIKTSVAAEEADA
jgi:dynein heavy chain